MPDANDFSPEELQVLIPLFVSSGTNYLAVFRQNLELAREGRADEDSAEVLHRSIHSLKGAALQLQLAHIGSLAKAMEEVVKTSRHTGHDLPADGIARLEKGADQLTEYIQALGGGEDPSPPPADMIRGFQQLAESLGGDSAQDKAVGE